MNGCNRTLQLGFWALFGLSLFATSVVAQADSEYQHTIEEAVAAYANAQFARAHASFERAHALQPSARSWRGLGMSSIGLKQYARATAELNAALRDERSPLTEDMRSKVTELLEWMSADLGTVSIEVSPAEARVLVDGASIQGNSTVLDPGEHSVVAEVNGFTRAEQTLVVSRGERQHLRIVLVPASNGNTQRSWSPRPLSSASPALLTATLATIFALLALGLVFRRRLPALAKRGLERLGRRTTSNSGLGATRVAATEFAALVPDVHAGARDAIAEFMRTNFGAARVLSPGALQMFEARGLESQSYDYFVLLIAPQSQDLDVRLATQTFIACAAPIEAQLAGLPAGRRKVVLVISSFSELGRGVRARMLHYRVHYDAIVVPVYVGEIHVARRDGMLDTLFDERVASLHPDEDLYSEHSSPDVSSMVGMYGAVQEIVGALQNSESLVVVDGLPGSGKTALVLRAAYDSDEPFARIRCASIQPRTFAIAAGAILRELQPQPDSDTAALGLSELLGRISSEIAGGNERPILVLEDADWLLHPLDEPARDAERFQECKQFWSGMLSFGIERGLRVIVIAVRGFALCQNRIDEWDNPVAHVVRRCSVPPLDRASMERLVREPGIQMNVQFHDSAVDLIYKVSAGNVSIARKLCSDAIKLRRGGPRSHRLRRLTVRARDIRSTVARHTGGTSAVGERTLRWLSELEKSVLHVIASNRPSSIDDIQLLLPRTEATQVRRAVDRLAQVGLIDGAYDLTIPFLQRWIVAYFGSSDPSNRRQRRFLWSGAGFVATALLTLGYLMFVPRRESTVVNFAQEGCEYHVTHPSLIVPGVEFSIVATRQCAQANDGTSLTLGSLQGTIARRDGKYVHQASMPLHAGGSEIRLTVDANDDNRHRFELRDAEARVATLELRTDWAGALRERADGIAQSLAAVPALLGLLATFFTDLRAQWARVVAALTFKRLSP